MSNYKFAYNFDGVDDYILAPIGFTSTTSFRACWWFRTTWGGWSSEAIFDSRSSANAWYTVYIFGWKVFFRVGSTANQPTTTGIYNDWEWHYFEAENVSGSLSLTVDTETVTDSKTVASIASNALYIWRKNISVWSGQEISWKLDDMKFYEDGDLKIWYRMNQRGGTEELDNSGNANHWTITNADATFFSTR